MKRSKRYRECRQAIDRNRHYPVGEAIALLKQTKAAKFDETVEFVALLGVDPKKADQQVRGSFALPNGIGQERRVICFAEGDKAEAALAAGADEVGAKDLVEKIVGGWMEFDVAVAAPEMMRFVGKLGRVLGPQGKMPSPKSGTVTPDVATAVREFKAGKIEFRVDSGANVHAPVGKRSFEDGKLVENVEALFEHLRAIKPTAAKGTYIKSAFLTTTMGPSVPVVTG